MIRNSLEFISRRIKTKKDIYFRKIFPSFTFTDISKANYRDKVIEIYENYESITSSWDIFAQRNPEDENLVKATILSNVKLDKKAKILPISKKANNSVILYAGGGGFLANLQLIQENFLKKWAKNTNITVFEAHYTLCPFKKYPYQINELFNLYMQIVLYYKKIQKVKNLRIAIVGDSAGGTIIMSLMNMLASIDIEIPTAVCTIYPALDLRTDRFSPSMLYSLEDQLLYFTIAKACFKAYVHEESDLNNDWLLCPAIAPDYIFERYPKTYIFFGEKDSMRDDCIRMGYKIHLLSKNQTLLIQVAGVYHGFLGFQIPLGFGVDEVDIVHKMIQRYLVTLLEASDRNL